MLHVVGCLPLLNVGTGGIIRGFGRAWPVVPLDLLHLNGLRPY
jgi:hypothetical protein